MRNITKFLRIYSHAKLAGVFLSVLFTTAAMSQVDRTSLNGTVTYASGGVLPDVHVQAIDPSTGLRRETVSSAVGTYEIPQLPVGTYVLLFSRPSYQSLRFENVVQETGKTRTLNATMLVGAAREEVDVTATRQALDQTSDSLGTDTEPKQISELPLNGRNWATLTALAPGAVDTGGSNQRTIRFAGRGRDDNDFTYDGIDATKIINQAQQPYVRLAIPLETIEEIKIDSALVTAEEGGTAGGQIVVTSPSGTNQLHGSVFEFLRNNFFDAKEPIDALNPHQPPFHLNQFGGSFGGPIKQNKAFFFVSYEGYRQELGQTLPGFVPTQHFARR